MHIIFKLILFILFVFTIWYIWKSIQYRSPEKFILVMGKPGAFKTTDMCRRAIKALKGKTWKYVYANTHISVPGVRYFKTEDFGDFWFPDYSLVLLDELNLFYDNRGFKTLKKSVIEYTRLYRHNHVCIVGYSQGNDVDKKFRTICNEMWLYYKIAPTICLQRRLKKVLTLKQAEYSQDSDSQIVDNLEFESIFTPDSFHIINMEPYFKYHNSYSRPDNIKLMPYQDVKALESVKTFKIKFSNKTTHHRLGDSKVKTVKESREDHFDNTDNKIKIQLDPPEDISNEISSTQKKKIIERANGVQQS